MSPNLVVKSNIKSITGGMNISSDFVHVLNQEVEKMISKACERARNNNRNTVMGRDI